MFRLQLCFRQLRVQLVPEGTTVADIGDLVEVVRRRWRGGRPFQGPAFPGVVTGRFSPIEADQEVGDEDQQGQHQDRRRAGREHVHRPEIRDVGRIGEDPARHAEQTHQVHDEEGAVEADDHQPEMRPPPLFRQEAAGHLRVPVVDAGDDPEEHPSQQHVVEMSDDKVAVGELPVDGDGREGDSAQAADGELDQKSGGEQHRGGEGDRATPHGGDPEDLKIKKVAYYDKDLNFVVELDNNTKKWMIKKPEEWPANIDEINGLVDALKDIDIVTNLGVLEDNNTYEISDSKYLLLENGKTSKIYIGKRDPSYKMVYVKVNEDKEVKLVDATFTNYLPTTLNQIKDKTIYTFDEEKLKNYKIKIDNKTYEIALKNGSYVINDKTLNDSLKKTIFPGISTLTANTFVDRNTLDNATKVGYIHYTVDNNTENFQIFKDRDGDYLIPASGESIFKLYNFTIENFLKKFEKS